MKFLSYIITGFLLLLVSSLEVNAQPEPTVPPKQTTKPAEQPNDMPKPVAKPAPKPAEEPSDMPKPVAKPKSKPAEEPSDMPKPITRPAPQQQPSNSNMPKSVAKPAPKPASTTKTQTGAPAKKSGTNTNQQGKKPTAPPPVPVYGSVPTTEPAKIDYPYHIYKSSPTFSDLQKALKSPERVYRLDLSGQKLHEIPQDVFKLPNLMYLNLSGNRIVYLPKEIGKLKNLIELNLSKNRLDTLPDQLGDLSKLRFLNLCNNAGLYKFPVGLRGLKKLNTLNVVNTNIMEFELNFVRRYLPECKLEY